MNASFLLEAVFKVGTHTILTGTVKEGVLKPGMKFDLNGKSLIIEKIESMGVQLHSAPADSKVGISFKNLSPSDLPDLKLLIKNRLFFS
ncbi:MAG: hypothetical protein ABH842_04870 [Candidatus Micrarchaeota archaeon]